MLGLVAELGLAQVHHAEGAKGAVGAGRNRRMQRRRMVWGHRGVQDSPLHVGLHRQHVVGVVVVGVVVVV